MSTSPSPSAASPSAAASWSPRIVAFFCNWCTYTAADLAGVSRLKYAPNARVIRLMCSGRVDPQFVMDAFARGADGVLIGGCHPGDCHYVEGNLKMLRRFHLLKRLIATMGIEEQRLRLEWISAAEGEKVKTVIDDMTTKLVALGPLGLPGRFIEWDREVAHLEETVAAAAEAQSCCAEPNPSPTAPSGVATIEAQSCCAPSDPSRAATPSSPAPSGPPAGAQACCAPRAADPRPAFTSNRGDSHA